MSDIYEVEQRQPKSAVGYAPAHRDANNEIPGEACGRCEHYKSRSWLTSGACRKVEGPISGRYWCRLFEVRNVQR